MFETTNKVLYDNERNGKGSLSEMKANHGAAGVDKESLELYQADLLNNLYVLWNA